MTNLRSTFSGLLLALVCLAAPAPTRAADAAEELLRYVPEDVNFCLVVRDLRGHAAALADSPFLQAWRKSPFVKGWENSKEIDQLKQLKNYLEGYFQITVEQLRDDILGDAVVMAYRGGPSGKLEQDQGLILIRARDPKKLADLVDRINKVTGGPKAIEEREHNGQKYFRRGERGGESFFVLHGPVLVFSGQEAMIREALKVNGGLPANGESPVGKNLRVMGADRALAAFWLNPRAFDAEVAALRNVRGGPGPVFAKAFLDCWKNIDGIAFTFSLTKDIEIGLTIRGNVAAMPAAVRRFLSEASIRSELWNRFPDDALLAIAARTSASTLADLVSLFQGQEAFKSVQEQLNLSIGAIIGGKDVVTEVLPHVGPDWGLCAIAPPKSEKTWAPYLVLAVRVSPGDKVPPVDRSLVTMLQTYAQVFVVGYNRQGKDPLAIKTHQDGKREIHFLASKKGAIIGFQPAFGLCDGYLVLASTPAAYQWFASTKPVPSTGDETPLLRMSFKEIREYLKERRDPLVAFLAEQNHLPAQQIGQQIDSILTGLDFVDRLELTQRGSPGQVTFTLRVKPANALRK